MKYDKIKAIRGGVIRLFTMQMWNNLPKDKLGWRPFTETPEEILQHMSNKVQPSEPAIKEQVPIDLSNEGIEIKEKIEVNKRGRKPKSI